LAPVLPLLVLLLAGGWWAAGSQARRAGHPRWVRAAGIWAAGRRVSTTVAKARRSRATEGAPNRPQITAPFAAKAQDAPVTVVVVPTSKDSQTSTPFTHGRRRKHGGTDVGRETGNSGVSTPDSPPGQLAALRPRRPGHQAKASRRLGASGRSDPRFALAASWPLERGRQLELWQRRSAGPLPGTLRPPASSAWPSAFEAAQAPCRSF